MKYFKHDLTAFEDDKVWELIESHGMQGYGIWWWLLEQLYAAEENGFLINATDTWFKKASKNMNLTDWRTLIRILDTLSDVGLIDSQLWADHHIYCPGIIKRADSYIAQKAAAKERKRRQRERVKLKKQDDCHTGVTRDNADVTRSHTVVTTNTDPDTDPDTDLKEKKEEGKTAASAATPPDEAGQKEKPKPPKKLTKHQCQKLVDIYQKLKPELWADVKVLGEKRIEMADRAYQAMGRDIEATKEVVTSALRYVSTQAWWTEKKGKFTFGTLFERGKGGQGEYRFIEWSELENSSESQDEVKGNQVRTEIRQEIDRLGLNGVVPAEFRGGPDQVIVSQLDLDSAEKYLLWLKQQQPAPKAAWRVDRVAA